METDAQLPTSSMITPSAKIPALSRMQQNVLNLVINLTGLLLMQVVSKECTVPMEDPLHRVSMDAQEIVEYRRAYVDTVVTMEHTELQELQAVTVKMEQMQAMLPFSWMVIQAI